MKSSALLVLWLATALVAANGDRYPSFPFCNCKKSPSPYSVSPVVEAKGNGTYCFTITVKVPPSCSSPCCTADLKKMEFNVYPTCDVFAARVKATVNGVPTKVGPSFDNPKEGPPGATLLKLTQLGLGLGSDGTEICVTLSSTRPDRGCTTLEQLCVPPAGSPAGVCSIALFDSSNDCCPISNVPPGVPSSPPPATPPLAPGGSTPCTVCYYLVLQPTNPGPRYPWYPPADLCDDWEELVLDEVQKEAARVGAQLVDEPTKKVCGNDYSQVCNTFASSGDAALLQPWIGEAAKRWLALFTYDMPTDCPAWMFGLQRTVMVGGAIPPNGDPLLPPPSCLTTSLSVTCIPELPPFPACVCNTAPLASPFAAEPMSYERVSRSNRTSLFCFKISLVTPANPNSPCGRTTVLYKAEIFADDKLRKKVAGVAVKTSDATDYTYLASTWGSIGENTLKATPLQWNKTQANGAEVCIELDKSTSLTDLCGSPNTCWINFFDESKSCCPLYATSFLTFR